MALTVGELVAYATIDNTGFTAGLAETARDMSKLQSSTSSSMASMESTVTRAMNDVTTSIGDGFDPAAALADIDRLVTGFATDLDRMEADAGQGAQGIVNELRTAFVEIEADAHRGAQQAGASFGRGLAELDDIGRRAGQESGDALVDGLRAELQDAERVARQAGDDAGREFGDGVEVEGRGRMGGVADGLMSSLKAAPWLAAGAAIGAALTAGLGSALEGEALKAKLNAQIGAYGEDAEKYGRIAGELYAQAYGDGLGSATEAVKTVVHNLGGIGEASKENVGQIAKDGIIAADILNADVSEAVRATGTLVRTGLVKDWTEGFDLIVAATQKGGDASGDLLETLTEYSTQFRAVGIDGPKAFGLLSQAWKGGARDLDTVADALKEFAIRSKDGSKTSTEAFQSLGLNAKDMFQVFAKGGPDADAAMKDVIDRLKAMKDPVEQDATAVALFGGKSEDLQKALYALDPAKATQVLGDFGGAVKKAGDEIQGTADKKLTAFKNSLQSNFVDFLGGTVIPAVEQFAADFDRGFELTGASEKVQEWRDELGEIWDSIVADVQEWVDANGETIDEWKTKLSEGFESAKTVVDDALALIKELWDEYGDDVIETVTYLVDTFLNIWNTFWGVVGGAVKVAKGILTGDFEEIKEGLTQIWDSLWQGIEDQVTSTLDLVEKIAQETWDNLKKDAEAAWERLSKAVSDKIDEVVRDVKNLKTGIETIFAGAKTWLLQAGKDLLMGFISGITAKAQEVVDTVSGITQKMVDAAKRVIDSHSPSKVFDQIGRWTMQGLIQGLTAEGANVTSTVEKMVTDIKKAFESRPDVADGLIDFVKVGNKNLEDLALQRQALVQALADAKEMAKRVAGTAQEWADITGLKAEDITGAGDMAAELQGKASAINDFANNIQTLAKRGLNKKIIQDIIDAGVEKGASFAEMLVGSDGSEIKALNKAQAAVDKASKKLGKASADAMYDVGKKSGEGYLKGLTESLKELDKEMKKIVDALVKAIKKELKIKSPSQVMAEIGQYTMAGYIEGIQSMESSTMAAMTGLVGKAVSATSDAAIGSVSKAASTLGKQQILNATSGTAGVAFDGPLYGGPNAGKAAPPAGTVVNVDMTGAVIREEADVARVGKEFGYELAVLS